MKIDSKLKADWNGMTTEEKKSYRSMLINQVRFWEESATETFISHIIDNIRYNDTKALEYNKKRLERELDLFGEWCQKLNQWNYLMKNDFK